MISVIVPVYNVEKYLAECLDSILNQTYTDLEIICVNDGSTDNSLKILNEYAQKDNRIKVISQKNKGLSGARNTGIKHSSSEYLTFIDSDDIIKPTYMETLWNNKDKADCVQVNMELFNDKMERLTNNWFETFYLDKETKLIEITPQNMTHILISSWGKLLKKSILQKYNITFYEGIIHEDYAHTYEYLFHCKNLYYINEKLYLYRQRENSITKTELNTKQKLDIIKVFIHVVKHIKKYDNKIHKYRKFILTSLKREGKTDQILNSKNLQTNYYTHKLATLLNIKTQTFKKLLEVDSIRINIENPTNDKKIEIYNTNFTKYRYEHPTWLKNGISLITNKNNLKITYKVPKNTIIKFFTTPYIYIENKKTLKVKSFKINNIETIATPIYTKDYFPYIYNIDTQNNEFIEIFVNYELVYNYKPKKMCQIELITNENTPLSITSKTKLNVMEYKYPNCEKGLKAIILNTDKKHFEFKINNPNSQNIEMYYLAKGIPSNQKVITPNIKYKYIKINKIPYATNIIANIQSPIQLISQETSMDIEVKYKIKEEK